MNEFTKEELIKLKNSLEYYSDATSLIDQNLEENNAFALKIQSLIDNYCDHEWRTSAIDAIYCPHCQKHIEYEL